MTAAVAQLVEKALLLPSEARSELVEAILERSACSGEIIEEHMLLVEERMKNVASGKTKLVPEEEAHQSVLDSLRLAK
jgi:hypothetical protein